MAMDPVLERTLRVATLASSGLAFPFVIIAGCVADASRHSWMWDTEPISIFFSIIPLFFTTFAGIIYLHHPRKNDISEPKRSWFWVIADFMIFGGYLTDLIVVWIREPQWLNQEPSALLLEAYATVPLIVNMFMHAAFFVLNSKLLIRALVAWSGANECPHCHHQASGCGEQIDEQGASREDYSLLAGADFDEDAGKVGDDMDKTDDVLEV